MSIGTFIFTVSTTIRLSANSISGSADGKFVKANLEIYDPEKLVFDGSHYRTARLNEAVSLIYSLDNGFNENENGQTEVISDLSTLVNRIVQFSNHFIPDLTRLANLMTV